MVLKYTNKTNFILLDGFARVCTLSANFPDNPRITELPFQGTLSNQSHSLNERNSDLTKITLVNGFVPDILVEVSI